MTYIFVVILLLILSSKYDYDDSINPQKKEKVFWIVCVIFILIAGLRYNLGADTTDGYAPEYLFFPKFSSASWLSEMSDYTRYQPGWFIFESVCRLLSPNFVVLQLAQAAFINIVFFYFIKKYSKLWFATVLIYAVSSFFLFNTEILREAMAVAFALLSFDRKNERKYIPMAIYAILSFLFHVSGIMVAILLLLSLIKDTKRTRLITLLLCSILTISFASMNINLEYINFIFGEKKVDTYFNQDVQYNYSILGWILYYAKNLAFPLFLLCFIPIRDEKRESQLMFIAFIFFYVSRLYTFAFTRFANYFFPFYWIAVSSFIYYFTNKFQIQRRTFLLLLISSLIWFSFYGNMNYKETVSSSFKMVYERYFPYRSVLEPGNTYLP